MPRPEDRIRRYLDANQGSVNVSVRQALSSWGGQRTTQEDRARIARYLAAAGVECDPPLVEGELDSRVTLRVREEPRATGPREEATAATTRYEQRTAATRRPEEPAAAPSPGDARSSRGRDPAAGRLGQTAGGSAQGAKRAGARVAAFNRHGDRALVGALVAGGVGSLIALGPDRIYGFGLGLGVLALALLLAARGGDPRPAASGWAARLPWVAGGLAALALLLGVLGSLTIETSPQPGTGTAEARERDDFCVTSPGDELARLSVQGTRSAEGLRDATDAVLDIADDAPPGADCAVLALDTLADAWNIFRDFPEYDDAEDRIERIRDLQEDRGLRESAM